MKNKHEKWRMYANSRFEREPVKDWPPICGECGSRMKLQISRHYVYKDGSPRKFYICKKYPTCLGTCSAHPDGQPMGIPSDKETRMARHELHGVFDVLWNSDCAVMERNEAYEWLANAMEIDVNECHISRFTKHQCNIAISAILNSFATTIRKAKQSN